MTNETRALIEAAEEAKQILNDAGNSSFSDSIIESINILEAAISSAKAAEGVETKVEIRYRVDTVLFGKATPCSAAVKTREEAESYRLPIDRMTRIETREFIEVREKEMGVL